MQKHIIFSCGWLCRNLDFNSAGLCQGQFLQTLGECCEGILQRRQKKDDSTPDKEKKEEKANPEKSGSTTTTTTTTQPESGKSTTNRSLSSTTCRLRKTRLFRNWATNALKYANTSRYRQKTIVVRAKHRDDTQRRGDYSHCRRQRPVSAKRHHTAPNGGKSAAPIYGIP